MNWSEIVLEAKDKKEIPTLIGNRINKALGKIKHSDKYPIGIAEDILKKHDENLYIKKDGMDKYENQDYSKTAYPIMRSVEHMSDEYVGSRIHIEVDKKANGKYSVVEIYISK